MDATTIRLELPAGLLLQIESLVEIRSDLLLAVIRQVQQEFDLPQ
jgi:hypothetical protein